MNRPTTRLLTPILVTATIASLTLLGGCTRLRRNREVPIANALSMPVDAGALALDIENASGTVSVRVDPRSPMAVWAASKDSSGAWKTPDWVAASLDTDNGRSVLRILSTAGEGQPKQTRLRIRVPSCGGLRVRNSGGFVDIQGVTGAIDVQNEIPFGTGRSIKVVAAAPITAPVGLHTTHGSVDLRLPVGSTGSIKAHTSKGALRMDGFEGTLTQVRTTANDWSGILNGGTNAIDLRTEEGDIILMVGR